MKKELFLPIIIFALTLVFAVICLMVYLSKGNAYWIKRKLKIGALLLTFNGIVYGTNGQDDSCYLVGEEKQTVLFIGPIFSQNYTSFKRPVLQSNANSYSSIINEIEGSGFGLGLTYEYHIGFPEESISSFIVNGYYDNKSAKYNVIELETTQSVDGEKKIVFGQQLNLEYDFSFITIDVLYKQMFTKEVPLGLVFGFYFSIPIEYHVNEKNYITDTNDLKWMLIDEYNGEIKDASSLDYGAKLNIQYELILFQQAYFVPSIGWSYSFTNVVQNTDWTIRTWYLNVALRWAIRI